MDEITVKSTDGEDVIASNLPKKLWLSAL